MQFTQGQVEKLRGIDKAKFKKLSPQRQVAAIEKWVKENKKSVQGLDVFRLKTAEDLRGYVAGIGDWLGCYTANPTFQSSLRQITLREVDPYQEVVGAYGRVPRNVVRQICEQYKMERSVVLDACNSMARPKGDNGVKILKKGSKTDAEAELKLMPMGNQRVFANNKIRNAYVFDRVGKHL